MDKELCFICQEPLQSFEAPFSDERGNSHHVCHDAERFITEHPKLAKKILETVTHSQK